MSHARSTEAAARVLDLRTPLARIALTAERFCREAARPVDQALARGIRDAVDDVDARIDRILRLLVESDPSGPRVPLDSLLAGLDARLAPALAARDIRLDIGSDDAPSAVDPHALRRLAVALLQGAAEWLGRGGIASLDALDLPEARGLRVRLIPAAAQPPCGETSAFERELPALTSRWSLESSDAMQLEVMACLPEETP